VAFETIRGESGVDFVGTAGVDALFALNETGSITAEGLAGNDAINIANSSGVVGTTTVKGGEGNDTISFQDANAADVSRLLNSSVNGGAGDDTISTEGA
jgi:Ca2+-binding RTX toxin-like protein